VSVLLLARTAVVTAVTGAVLLSGLTVAGAASAAPDKDDSGSKSVNENKSPELADRDRPARSQDHLKRPWDRHDPHRRPAGACRRRSRCTSVW
jgi:hypothetical protein